MERYMLIFCFDESEPIIINPDLNWRLRKYKAYKRLVSDYYLNQSQYDFTHMIGWMGNDFERNQISLQVTATKKAKAALGK